MANNEALHAAEKTLAESVPFGSYEHIWTRIFDQYVELLTMIAELAPGARALLDSIGTADGELRRLVLGDPLVRRTVEDGVCLHLLGHDAIDNPKLNGLLAAAAEHAKRRRAPLLAETTGCISISSASHHGYIWSGAAADSNAARRFTAQCLGRIPGVRIERPTDQALASIVEGANVVDSLLPYLGRSALSHTFMVVVVTSVGGFEFDSLTVPGIPGVIFLSPTVLTSPVRAADAILHESMHLKLMDIDYAEHLFVLGFRPQLSPTVSPPWHSDDQQQWPLDRILTAMHVYTGLAVFFGRIELAARRSGETDRSGYPVDPVMKYQRAIERARFLLEMSREYLDVFSTAGQSFIGWIAKTQKYLDVPSPQPQWTDESG